MWLVSATCLIIVITCCTLGVFSRAFADNMAQRLGMIGIVFFSLPRLLMILKAQEVSGVCMPVDAQVLGHVGMALYCLGTAGKVIRFRFFKRGMLDGFRQIF